MLCSHPCCTIPNAPQPCRIPSHCTPPSFDCTPSPPPASAASFVQILCLTIPHMYAEPLGRAPSIPSSRLSTQTALVSFHPTTRAPCPSALHPIPAACRHSRYLYTNCQYFALIPEYAVSLQTRPSPCSLPVNTHRHLPPSQPAASHPAAAGARPRCTHPHSAVPHPSPLPGRLPTHLVLYRSCAPAPLHPAPPRPIPACSHKTGFCTYPPSPRYCTSAVLCTIPSGRLDVCKHPSYCTATKRLGMSASPALGGVSFQRECWGWR